MGYLDEDTVKENMIGKTIENVDSESEYSIKIHFTDKTSVCIGIFCGDGTPSYFFEEL